MITAFAICTGKYYLKLSTDGTCETRPMTEAIFPVQIEKAVTSLCNGIIAMTSLQWFRYNGFVVMTLS